MPGGIFAEDLLNLNISATSRYSSACTTRIDSDEILQRFAHLESLNVQMPCMPKVINPGATIVIGLDYIR